jgi:small subunit ribosomal protein S28e
MGSNKKQRVREVKGDARKTSEKGSKPIIPAVVEEIIGRTGFRGEITQVKARLLEGVEKDRSMRRNVKGSIKVNDVLMLREIDIEARKIKSKVTKGAYT